jgi:hypothetical protein
LRPRGMADDPVRSQNEMGRERPHPLTHRASRLLWGRSRPKCTVRVRRLARRTWLGLRLLVNSSPVEMLKELRNRSDEAPPPTPNRQTTTFDLPLNDAAEAATGGTTLDAAALWSLRRMFLLLDEWDRLNQHTARDFSEECVTVLDTEI